MRSTYAFLSCVCLLASLPTIGPAAAFEFFPSNEEILSYRKSWNPLSNGPILLSAVDINPKGQFHSQYFVFGEIGHQMFENTLTTHRNDSSFHLAAAEPLLTLGYGLTDHLEFDAAFTGVYFDSSQATAAGNRTSTSTVGLGDTALYLKYRPIIQNPNSWRPSITIYSQLGLPTSDWAGTRPIPGGFSPLGKLPATSFGALTLTEGLLFRKNLQPFRFSGGVFYTYAVPGHSAGTTYQGDIVNTRFIAEYIVNEERGFGFNLEFVTVHGIPGRLDGHAVTVTPSGFNLFGIEPAVQYKFGSIVGAAGVLFTLAGQNDIAAVYPNISLYYYWDKHGTGVMR